MRSFNKGGRAVRRNGGGGGGAAAGAREEREIVRKAWRSLAGRDNG